MKKKHGTAKLLKFGASGHTIEYVHDDGTGSQQGYCDPEDFLKPYHWWADAPNQMSLHWESINIPEEGIPVVDMRAAVETPQGRSWVFKGPILDVRLSDGEIDRLPEVSAIMVPAVAAYGQGLALLETIQAKRTSKPGPLDSVGIADYIQGWREHGARIGRFYIQNGQGQIDWE